MYVMYLDVSYKNAYSLIYVNLYDFLFTADTLCKLMLNHIVDNKSLIKAWRIIKFGRNILQSIIDICPIMYEFEKKYKVLPKRPAVFY